jgi:hypothetical protein
VAHGDLDRYQPFMQPPLGVPLVVMYGAERSQRWLPRPLGSPVLAVGGPPRSQHVTEIAVDEVFECWQGMLSAYGRA